MGATLMLVGLIWGLVHLSRKRRADFIVSVRTADRDETWTFNVRDMNATRGRTPTSRQFARYELRRAGRWEMAERSETDNTLSAWTACDPATASTLEDVYVRYTGDAPLTSPSRSPYRGT